MTVGERIKELRNSLGMSQVDFADRINVSKQTLYKYENNIITNIPSDKIESAAQIGNVSPAYLMGWDINVKEKKESIKQGVIINVYGRVAAGIPIEAIQDIIDEEEIPEELAKTGDFFGLRITGDSMSPDIHDGDTVIVRRQDDAETDEIVVALVNGNDGVCKRLKKYSDSIALISNNPSYEPMYFSKDEIDTRPVRIIGKVVELRRKF